MNSQKITRLPTAPEVEAAKISSRTLSKYADAERVKMTLKGSNGQSDDLVLPGPVLQLLLDIMSEMARGNAISLLPIHHELSTQEAANILNVSRPHLVSLLEKGELPFRKVGSHRRVLAKDLFGYKARIDEQRLDALDQLTAMSQELDMGYEH
jgi:excisionase family DNA binding protein